MDVPSLLHLCAATLLFVPPSLSTDGGGNFSPASSAELLAASCPDLRFVNRSSFHAGQRPGPSAHHPRGFAFLRRPELESLEVSSAAELFLATVRGLRKRVSRRRRRHVTAEGTNFLSWEDVRRIAELSRCPVTDPAVCQNSHLDKYRSVTGSCNNRLNPLWGAANTALVRWLPAEYEDGLREPKGWNPGRLYNGFQLPPVIYQTQPREVSRKILKSSTKGRDTAYSQLLVEWGQYIDHDISFTPQSSGWIGQQCWGRCENVPPCFPIQTEDTDSGTQNCMPFHRSVPACFASYGLDIRQALQQQQMNSITSFIDASVVYGSSPKAQSFLRDLSGRNGKLAVNKRFQDARGRPYLPDVDMLPSACLQGSAERVECFAAGDSRVNEGLPLTAIHVLWLREHNRIAEKLKRINSHWNPETIFQETRKIVGAQHQIITMRDYIPKIIGPDSFQQHVGTYRGYDPAVDPSASNVFATAAFRFGHATISPVTWRLNESYQDHQSFSHLKLQETFFSPWRIVKEGGIEPILRGVIGTPATAVSADKLLAEEVTERLVVLNNEQHMDLASLNLQRGRDHALPGYNDWRTFCQLKRIRTLDDFTEVVQDRRVAARILQLYKHPDNIDVWLGGLVESILPGSRTGPLFACLIGKQMRALRDGDRFWWEVEGVFTQQQRAELLKASLSKIICDNTEIRELPVDPFTVGKYRSEHRACTHIPSMSLEAWREEKSQGNHGKVDHGADPDSPEPPSGIDLIP
ncbi:thyroid peroxidase [Aulostomus maculatus]